MAASSEVHFKATLAFAYEIQKTGSMAVDFFLVATKHFVKFDETTTCGNGVAKYN